MELNISGATLSKGLNRVFATFLAGALAVGAHQLASFSGERGEPIILGAFVFLIGRILSLEKTLLSFYGPHPHLVTLLHAEHFCF